MKTEKYSIQTFATEFNITAETFISKKEFERQMKHMLIKLDEVKHLICDEYYISQNVCEYEQEKMTITSHRFTINTTDVYLTHYKCKEGYNFVR